MNLNLPTLPVESLSLRLSGVPLQAGRCFTWKACHLQRQRHLRNPLRWAAWSSHHGCRGPWTSGDPNAWFRAARVRVLGVSPPGPLLLTAWLMCPSLKAAVTG